MYAEISTEFRLRNPEPTVDKPQRLGKPAQAVVAKGEGEIEDMQFRWSFIPLRKFSTMCLGWRRFASGWVKEIRGIARQRRIGGGAEFAAIAECADVLHPHRIEHPVEMVVVVL